MNETCSIKNKAANKKLRFIIALDGPSASGKGTIAKMLAKEFSMQHFASSIFYRRLASLVLKSKISLDQIDKIIELSKNTEELYSYKSNDIYSEEVTRLSSQIATISEVRENLKLPQRQLIEEHNRIILDGRDIGTVIAPDADLKIYMTASAEARARRRYEQLKENGMEYNLEEIIRTIKERDQRDQDRPISPLKPAEDAIIIDTTDLSPEETLKRIREIIEAR